MSTDVRTHGKVSGGSARNAGGDSGLNIVIRNFVPNIARQFIAAMNASANFVLQNSQNLSMIEAC